LYFDEICADPAWNLVLHQDPVPILGIHASDQLDIGTRTKREEIEILRTRPITAAQPIGSYSGFEACYCWQGGVGREWACSF
jgi:hypothetical protein